MNCEIFQLNIDALIDGEVDESFRKELLGHAEHCAACREMLEQAEMVKRMCEELSEADVPLPAQAAWRKAVRSEAKRRKSPLNLWMRSAATIAAALVVLVMGTYGVRMGETVPASNEPTIELASDYISFNNEMWSWRKDRPTTPLGMNTAETGLQSDGSVGDTRSLTTANENSTAVEPVVLRSAARSIESQSYDADVQWLNDLVSEYDAYFEERSETAATEDGLTGRISKAAVRVPSSRLDNFLMELDQLGRTVLRSESAEDVTGRYMDTQSRLNALKLQKEKLDEMMAGAASVEELIAIDDKLTDVIASIETLEGDLRRWESQRSYSRVELTLTEILKKAPEAEASLGVRMKQGFDKSVQWLKEFGQDALVMLASAAPRLVVWIPALVLVIVLVCAIRGRKRR